MRVSFKTILTKTESQTSFICLSKEIWKKSEYFSIFLSCMKFKANGRENVYNFLPGAYINPSTFFKTIGLYNCLFIYAHKKYNFAKGKLISEDFFSSLLILKKTNICFFTNSTLASKKW